jgi:hypothetical protein
MLEKMSQSSGNVLGYKVIGKLTKEDYATVAADIEALGQQESSIGLLLDLEAFEGEEIEARGAELSFRGDYQERIAKLAIVGDRLNYTRELRFFPTDEREAAWEWSQT